MRPTDERSRASATHPADWLILAGDVGETAAHLELAFRELKPRFAKLVWVPGNHELWTLPSSDEKARGRFKYDELIELCRFYEVLTPEDSLPNRDDRRKGGEDCTTVHSV